MRFNRYDTYVFFLIALAILVTLFAVGISAQTITSYRIQIYNPGVDPVTGAPIIQSGVYASTVVPCNQPPPAATATRAVNPRKAIFDDAANAGKVCIITMDDVFTALPIIPGDYTATVTVTDDQGLTSPRSAASNPFGRSALPSARTGLRVLP